MMCRRPLIFKTMNLNLLDQIDKVLHIKGLHYQGRNFMNWREVAELPTDHLYKS